MSKALDRSQRAGSDPIQIGSTKLVTDGNNDLTIQDTSNNRKKILASEVHLGDSSNVVILKKGSDNKIEFQTQASGGSATSSNAGGTVVYATINAMTAVSASAGDQALVTANSGLYVHNGGGWYKVATINTSPTISSPSTGGSFVLALDGTATTIELVGADVDEGTTLQNSYAVTTGSLTNGGGATATITTSSTSNGTYTALNPSTNTTNRFFKVTPTTNTSYAGSFTLTFSVSDGINAATTVQSFSLEFTTYGSAYFDGSGDHLLVPNTGTSTDLVIGTNNFTIEFWVKANSFSNGGVIYDTRANHAAGLMINFNTSGNLRLYANSGYRITADAIVTNEWQHYAIVRNSGTTKLYLNGTADSETYSDTNNYTGNTVYIGKHNSNTGADFNGYISNLRLVVGTAVYTSNFTKPTSPLTAITNTKLLTAHKNNEIVDSSSIAHNIAKNGNVTHHASNPFPWNTTGYGSLYFDGSGDYLGVTGGTDFTFGTGAFTVECWYQPKFDTAGSSTIFLYDIGSEHVRITFKSGDIRAQLGSETQISYSISGNSLDQNTWYHSALTRDGSGNVKLFHNGTVVGSYSSSTYNVGSTSLRIGDKHSGSKEFTGYISNFRVVTGTTVYTSSGFTPSTTPLTAITNTKLLTAQRSTPLIITSGSTLFDGTNDNLSIPSFAIGTNNYTIEMWFYPTAVSNYVHLYDGRGGSSGNAILLQLTNTGTVRFYSVSFRISGSDQVSANTWNHVALERVGNVNTLYLNGVSQGTYNDGGTSYVGPANNVGRIGSDDSGSGSFFPGYISDFRIVIGSAVYNGAFAPPTSTLTAITNTQILTSRTSTGSITDASSNNHTITANGGAAASSFGVNKIATDQSTFNNSINAFDNTRNAVNWPFNYNG